MTRLRLWLGTIAVTAALGFLLMEAIGISVFYQRTGALYYTHRPNPESLVPAKYQAAEAVFHPYYSFIHRAGRANKEQGWGTNNMGFQVATTLLEADARCCDYPMPRKQGEVLVGIFGGSVAGGFALIAQRSETLRRILADVPAFRGREVRILNFAMPGFRQPQQLITLSYFYALGQEFDVVVEMDGFNEVVTSFRNWEAGVEPAYPADSLWGAWGRQLERAKPGFDGGTPEMHLAAYYQLQGRIWDSRAERCWLASCHLVVKLGARLALWREETLAQPIKARSDSISIFPTAAQSRFDRDFEIFAYTADRWRDSSRAMADLARQRGALYLHVIQPNQWWKPSGEYRPIAPDHIYQWVIDPVNKGYRQLLDRVPQLIAAGVEVLDVTQLFKGMPDRQVYLDDCCHYTDAGNEMLMIATGNTIAEIQRHGRMPIRR